MKGLSFKGWVPLAVLMMAGMSLWSQTASKVIQDAVEKSSQPDAKISSIIGQVEKAAATSRDSDKRSLYTFLGSLTEQLGQYHEAATWYGMAAGIAAPPATGTPSLTTEQLVLAAVRCSLSCGDSQRADTYLESLKDSTVAETVAYSRLYSLWSRLCRVDSTSQLVEPLSLLETYASLESMELVRPPLYLTLWYLTEQEQWSQRLQKEYPKSAEAALVAGEAQLLPSPFWFFLPQKESVAWVGSPVTSGAKASGTETSSRGRTSATDAQEGGQSHVVVKQQVGFFRNRENAENLAQRLRDAGFKPNIAEEQRQSGTVYFVVTVPEDKDNTIGLKLKTAGFECYPVFADE